MRGEDEWVARIVARVASAPALRLGPGHDCAALDVPSGVVVVTTDVLVEGVHFRLAEHGARAVARKALLVNLSDLAAAAARPVGCEVGVVLPRGADPALLEEMATGFAEVAERYGCPVAGGDTNVGDGPLVLAVTAFGEPGPGGIVSRRGARPGDRLSVTGPLGGSLGGRHHDIVPRLAEGGVLAELGIARAMMDLSDGLSRDLPRLCRASDVGCVVVADRVPIHTDVEARDAEAALAHALDDGEDFELLVAHAPLDEATRRALAGRGVTLSEIGTFTDRSGVVEIQRGDRRESLQARGWDHFASPAAATATWALEVGGADGMRRLGAELGRAARSGVAAGALLVGLHGDLGAGKTVFVQGVARGFGVGEDAPVVSPTFTIARSYPVPGDADRVLHHVDAYRLGGPEDLEHAGFEDMCGEGCLTCVEWAGRVEEGLPSDRLEIEIAPLSAPGDTPPGEVPETPRRLRVVARGPRARELLRAWRSHAEERS